LLKPPSSPPPTHTQGLPVVTARLRAEDGTNHCSKMRRHKRTPGLLFSLPGEKHLLLDLESKEAAAHVSVSAASSGCRGAVGVAAAARWVLQARLWHAALVCSYAQQQQQ